MPTDTNIDNLVINVLTEEQYEEIDNPSSTELYLVPDEIDSVPTENSTNPITSGAVYTALNQSGINVSDKADKVTNATNGNFAGLDSNGNLTDSGKSPSDYYTKAQVDGLISAGYIPKGSVSSISNLGTLEAAHLGWVYNIGAAFTTTSDFVEGAGASYPIGTNVVIVDTGTAQNPVYKYDVLSGFVDLSDYVQTSDLGDVATSNSYNDLDDLPTIPSHDVHWCYWNDGNSTMSGLTPAQIYQLADNNETVMCKFSTGGEIFVYQLAYAADEGLDGYVIKFVSSTFGSIYELNYNGTTWSVGGGSPLENISNTVYDNTNTSETVLADDDKFPFYDDSASTNRNTTWSNIKIKLKAIFDSIYHPIIDSSHKLSADFIEDGSTNKVINVKPDWNAASGDPAEILNKPIINGQVSGTNNGTQWTSFTIDDDTYDIPTPRQVGETFRTINGEEIFEGGWGDINIHDGYYFPNAVQDYDGNWYGAIVLGNKVWLAENLRCTHYSDGTAITDASTVDPNDITNPVPYYRDNTNSSIPLEKRGLFYNWYAVMNGASASDSSPSGVKGIAPGTQANGDNIWHIPSKDEFEEFVEYINGQRRYYYSGTGSSRSIASTEYWNYSSGEAHPGNNLKENNATSFCAIPTGNFTGDLNQGEGVRCSFWSTQEINNDVGYYMYIEYNNAEIEINYNMKYIARSVRCVCDLTPVQFRAWYVKQYGTMQHIVTNNNLEPQVFVCHYNNNSMDKTPAEIYAAHTDGKIVVCYDNSNKPFYLITIVYANNVYNICFASIETAAPMNNNFNINYILFFNNNRWIRTVTGVSHIPTPSTNDAGKILKVNAQGEYELLNA